MKVRVQSVRDSKSGQTVIFMAMVIVMLAFAALFYFDVHKILHVKAVSRNAGDSAALASARWQGISLNLVGSLNMAQASAITDSLSSGLASSPEAEAIAQMRQRIIFSGPIFGFVASQQAAKNNGIFNQELFESEIQSHVDLILDEYTQFYPEPFQASFPFTNAWEEYADMISLLGEHGVAVSSAWRYYSNYSHTNHLLLNPSFYDAIAGRSWCWFYHNAYDTLQNYNSWLDWDDLPPISISPPINSEINSLRLSRVAVKDSIPTLPPESEWQATLESLQLAFNDLQARDPAAYDDFDATWSFYNGSWGSWSNSIPAGFPWDRDIKPEFDYGGADAAVGVMAETERHTDFQGADTINWSAGAKPFGMLEGDVRPNTYGLVIPAFTDVRLIPIDATLSAGNGQLRPGWLEFIMVHLPRYMTFGPGALPSGNWYANQLRTWEQSSFRNSGLDWIFDNSDDCYSPPGGGGGGGRGGTFHGH